MSAGDDSMPLEDFARACGLTPNFLRFCARAGLLLPAHADEVSQEHRYAPEQVWLGTTLRRATDLAMPHADRRAVMTMSPEQADRRFEEYAAAVNRGDIQTQLRATVQLTFE